MNHPDTIEPTKDQGIINWLRSENAYLRGKVEAYEEFLRDEGYIIRSSKKWVQRKPFRPAMMGYRQGFALANVREGFGIRVGTYESAQKDMEDQRIAGTLHDINSLPKNISVPIYAWPKKRKYSRYGFVFVACGDGDYYADGKKVSKFFVKSLRERFDLYWAECCDGVRVVAEEEE